MFKTKTTREGERGGGEKGRRVQEGEEEEGVRKRRKGDQGSKERDI